MYRWLFFDADGTLFDYEAAEAKALEGTFRELGMEYHPEYRLIYRKYNQWVWEEYEHGRISAEDLRLRRFDLLFDTIGISADSAVFSQHYLPNLAHGSDLIPGVMALIKRLHGRFHLAVITNGLKQVQYQRLRDSGLDAWLDAIIVSEEIGSSKPAQAYFDAAFRLTGYPDRKEVLIIGDSLSSDIRGGLNYGVDTCWYNPEKKDRQDDCLPVYEIHSWDELEPILGL